MWINLILPSLWITVKNTLIFTHSLSKGLDSNNVEVIHGYARFVDNHTVTVNGENYHAANILIATGGKPSAMNIPGGEYAIDSNGFALRSTKAYGRLRGRLHRSRNQRCQPTAGQPSGWAYRKRRPLRTFDKMLADNLVEMYQESGIETYAGYVASRIIKEGDEYLVHFENGETLTGDCVLLLVVVCRIRIS